MLVPLLAADYVVRDLRASSVAVYGQFTLEREDCIKRDPPVAVLHNASCLKKARLDWEAADKRISIRYEDDGEMLLRTVSYPDKAKNSRACQRSNFDVVAFKVQSGTNEEWQKAAKAFGAMLARCSTLGASQIAAYRAEFEGSARHYGQADAAFRTLATSMFRSLRRCTVRKIFPRGDPFSRTRCTHEEGPKS
jgi:hypothetical protein